MFLEDRSFYRELIEREVRKAPHLEDGILKMSIFQPSRFIPSLGRRGRVDGRGANDRGNKWGAEKGLIHLGMRISPLMGAGKQGHEVVLVKIHNISINWVR